ncbi:MAG TPA: DNA repair protein RecN [Bacteroidota bacterium]
MLKSLYIKNYALISEISIEFSQGLVIITGETGAGKSIIIDALSLVLGTRASAEVVRTGTDKAVVETVFQTAGNKKLKTLCEENDLECPDELIVRREVSAKGQSRCFINDTPVSLALQKQVGELLVDLHGQHEHQSLLRTETHIGMLDDFGGLDGMAAEFRGLYNSLRQKTSSLDELQQRKRDLLEKREFLAFQLREIDAVGPRPGEEEELERELKILENSERLFGSTGRIYEMLYEGEGSIHDQLVIVRNQLQNLAEIDDRFREAASECGSAEVVVSELAKFIQGYNARVEFNPERLEELRERLGRITMLKKKYGGSLEAVLEHRERIAQEVALAENFDEVIGRLEAEVESVRKECAALAQRLSAKRHDVARKIEKGIVAELAKLGIENGRFQTRIVQRELDKEDPAPLYVLAGRKRIALNPRGEDIVEFLISTNLGEDPKPLAKVASGGEVSRIMLALKSILAKSDRLPVLIFDEIDVGVSGRIAQAVGISLKALSGFHQVIAITHLPQIAGLADTHFAVSKVEKGGRATTTIRPLTLDEQVQAVARLMSGAEITQAGLAGARELMGLSK